MSADIMELRDFYASTMGRIVRQLLRDHVARLWPDVRGQAVLALGYATPLLRPWLGKVERLIAVMPETQGVAFWPKEGPNIACMADLAALPLADESVDRIIALHAMESAIDAEAVVAEIARVLKPEGRVLIIVSRRRGLWAHCEGTPFGTGQPYSAAQLKKLLKEEGFMIERAETALILPPWGRLFCSFAQIVEHYTGCFLRGFGGVLILEARRQLYAPTLVKTRSSRRKRIVLPLPCHGVSRLKLDEN